jgi:MoaA/NifB/PqqE/SkfB family radical SAM enzyme
MKYRVLYRGPLSSCNYSCSYCPFAKHAETYNQLAGDRTALDRFTQWLAQQTDCRFGVLFTPWGEALIRPWYQDALCFLSQLAHVERVAIQTNLSCKLDWVDRCRIERLALWATYHPTQVSRAAFLAKVRQLTQRGVRLSVGVVGLREHFEEIKCLRQEIPPDVYLWINAYKRDADYYVDEHLHRLTAIDPLFPISNQNHHSLGEPCAAGETSFTVDGDGNIRRCHFVQEPIGSIHEPAWRSCLRPRRCPNATCGCYIGFVNLQRLRLETYFGDGVLERIPLPARLRHPDCPV